VSARGGDGAGTEPGAAHDVGSGLGPPGPRRARPRLSPAARRTAWLAVALLLATWPWLVERGTAPPAEWRLTKASFATTVDDPQARPVALPHRWHGGAAAEATGAVGSGAPDCGECRTAWYRFDLGGATPVRAQPQALWLTDVGRNAAAYLNGRLLGSGGRFSDPAARLGALSMWLPVPPQAWNDDTNRLYLLVKADRARFGRLGAPALGPETELQTRERWRSALLLTLPQALATAAAMLGLVMAVLWAYRRRESDYGALAAVLAAWALNHFSVAAVEPPLADSAWDAWLGASLALFVAALGWLAWRMRQRRRPAPGPIPSATSTATSTATSASTSASVSTSVSTRWASVVVLAGLAVLGVAGAAAAALEPTGMAIDALRSTLLLAAAGAGVTIAAAGWAPLDGRLLARLSQLTVAFLRFRSIGARKSLIANG
jgi:hypothetical protein